MKRRSVSNARRVHEFSYLLRSVHPYIMLITEHAPTIRHTAKRRANARKIKRFLHAANADDQV